MKTPFFPEFTATLTSIRSGRDGPSIIAQEKGIPVDTEGMKIVQSWAREVALPHGIPCERVCGVRGGGRPSTCLCGVEGGALSLQLFPLILLLHLLNRRSYVAIMTIRTGTFKVGHSWIPIAQALGKRNLKLMQKGLGIEGQVTCLKLGCEVTELTRLTLGKDCLVGGVEGIDGQVHLTIGPVPQGGGGGRGGTRGFSGKGLEVKDHLDGLANVANRAATPDEEPCNITGMVPDLGAIFRSEKNIGHSGDMLNGGGVMNL